MLLSVIIVSYNTKDLTLQAMESVFKDINGSSLLKNKAEVWVVDNDSTDGSVEALKELRKKHSSLEIIFNKKNVGFATANNQAIEKSTGELVLLLNSDTVVEEGSLEKMLDAFGKHDRLGILAAHLINPDGSSQAQGGSFPTLISLASHMLLLDDIPLIGRFLPSTQHTGKNTRHLHGEQLQFLEWVGGTAMMVHRDVFLESGVLDSNIFMYGEDIEFCMRADAHQWEIAIHPSAKIVHFGSASSSSKNAIIGELKSYLYIWAKHKPIWQMGVVKWLLHTGVLLRIILFGTIIKDQHRAAIYKEARQMLRSA